MMTTKLTSCIWPTRIWLDAINNRYRIQKCQGSHPGYEYNIHLLTRNRHSKILYCSIYVNKRRIIKPGHYKHYWLRSHVDISDFQIYWKKSFFSLTNFVTPITFHVARYWLLYNTWKYISDNNWLTRAGSEPQKTCKWFVLMHMCRCDSPWKFAILVSTSFCQSKNNAPRRVESIIKQIVHR